MAGYVRWACYLSPYFYGNEGLYVAQWEGITGIKCEEEFDSECHYEKGEDILEFYHYEVYGVFAAKSRLQRATNQQFEYEQNGFLTTHLFIPAWVKK